MDEDELAAKMHGVYISEPDSDNSEDDHSDFDEEYEALKPPAISLKDREQDIIKITAFKVVSHKNNNLKNFCSKLNTNCKKPTSPAGKPEKNFKLNISKGNRLQRLKHNAKAVKSVGVSGEIVKEHKQSSSLISDVHLHIKPKFNESYIKKPLNNENSVIDYARAVKSSSRPLSSRNCDNQTLPLINAKDLKNHVNRKFKKKRKQEEAKR